MRWRDLIFGTNSEGGSRKLAELSPAETALRNELTYRKNDTDIADKPVRYALHWTGSVQGVGFRWTHQRYARQRGLTGWVTNNEDFSVDMEIQGKPQLILAHLERVHADYLQLNNPIWMETAEPQDVVQSEADFEVRIGPHHY